jgi:hypothetical protein
MDRKMPSKEAVPWAEPAASRATSTSRNHKDGICLAIDFRRCLGTRLRRRTKPYAPCSLGLSRGPPGAGEGGG